MVGYNDLDGMFESKLPAHIGSLERDALSYLGEWKRMAKEDFGFYYRMGIKEDVVDPSGEHWTVVLHFYAPFGRNAPITPEKAERNLASLKKMVELSTQILALNGNASAYVLPPEQYMLDELLAFPGIDLDG